MTAVALVLVLASAVCHASWNFLLKRSEHKLAFLGSAGIIGALTLLAPAIVVAAVDGIGATAIAFGLVTASLHGVYGLSLARGYRLGDLSSVYPVSRGVGLTLIPIGAAVFLDEHISTVAVVGIVMIATGVYALHIQPHAIRDIAAPLRVLTQPAGRTALVTGVLIASYSLWDKNALVELSPVVLNQFAMTGHALITTTAAARINPGGVRWEWRSHGWSIVAAGVLIQLAYLLVLLALQTSRVGWECCYSARASVYGVSGHRSLSSRALSYLPLRRRQRPRPGVTLTTLAAPRRPAEFCERHLRSASTHMFGQGVCFAIPCGGSLYVSSRSLIFFKSPARPRGRMSGSSGVSSLNTTDVRSGSTLFVTSLPPSLAAMSN